MPLFWSKITVRTGLLFAFWFLLSGKRELFYLAAGFLSALSIAWMSTSTSQTKQGKKKRGPGPVRRTWPLFLLMTPLRGCRYAIWLLGRILRAAVHVALIVVNPKMPLRPKLIRHKTTLKTNIEKVIFANSITLTPGTITGNLEGDTLTIHQLDDNSAADILSGAMEKEIRKIFS